jgi:hypothetical protein
MSARSSSLTLALAVLLGAAIAVAAPEGGAGVGAAATSASGSTPAFPAATSASGSTPAFLAASVSERLPVGSASSPSAVTVTSTTASSGTPTISSAAPSASVLPAFTYTRAVSPMPSGSAVPKAWLPPGADDPDPGPSMAVFPSQRLTLRMSHKVHALQMKMPCVRCHAAAATSTKSADWLLPTKHEACTACHSIDEASPGKKDDPGARCDFCHLGAVSTFAGGAWSTTVVRLQIPTANLKMSHKAHADGGVTCQQCHGEVQNLELATRDQMPRMKGCLTCHTAGGTAKAKTDCVTCHVTDKTGITLQTMFPSGTLMPPKWLKNASHGADWDERHKRVAGLDSAFCGNCHREQTCTDCHDGKVRPRSVHPNDWLNMHEVSARMDAPKCTSCHSTSGFCVPCHTRVGVGGASPSGVKTSSFHPPNWATSRRMPGDHSFEAQKNITACVSCHVERDCVTCHATKGVGGAGVGGASGPHGPSFLAKCDIMYAKNPRPCFVCHTPDDRNLARCR